MLPTRRRAVLLGAALCLAALAAVRPAAAQDADEFVNFAFACRLGSGVYSVDGQTIQIYRIGITTTLLEETETRPWRLDLSAPLTIGFYDFKPVDVIDEGLPTHLDSYSLTPGVRFTFPLATNWKMMPFVNGGPVRENATDSTSWVYTIGVRSEAHFPGARGLEWILRDEWVWSGMADSGETLADEFGEFHNGVEAWFPLNAAIRGKQLKIAPFVVVYYYWDDGEFVSTRSGAGTLDASPYGLQWEAGVLLDTAPSLEIWGIGLPSIGLSYRGGGDFDSIRLVLGSSF